jgi:hypothetical protein
MSVVSRLRRVKSIKNRGARVVVDVCGYSCTLQAGYHRCDTMAYVEQGRGIG